MKKNTVYIFRDETISGYPTKEDLFRPSTAYPEYIFPDDISRNENRVYDSFRKCLKMAGLDANRFGDNEWNPLGEYIHPGDTVLVKPNLVMNRNNSDDGLDCLCTNPSVIAALIDYVIIAQKGKGQIIIGDAPVQECDFEMLTNQIGLSDLIEYYQSKGISIKLKDFRGVISHNQNGVYHYDFIADAKYRCIDLGENSEFSLLDENSLNSLRIANYDPEILKNHHNKDKHEYVITQDIFDADIIINMPKPKTHRKAGVTISLKNMVGTCARKECLPHHMKGSKKNGGDEYESGSIIKKAKFDLADVINKEAQRGHYKRVQLLRPLRKILKILSAYEKDTTEDGSWYGNETISKTVIDINKIILYSDRNGLLRNNKQRNILVVADMIIAGEGEGPLAPTSKKTGIIAIGENQVNFDKAIASIMGMDINKIPTIINAETSKSKYSLVESAETSITSNYDIWNKKSPDEIKKDQTLTFIPAKGWIGYIEKKD